MTRPAVTLPLAGRDGVGGAAKLRPSNTPRQIRQQARRHG